MNRTLKRRISIFFQLLHGSYLRKQEIERKINHGSFLIDKEKVDDAKLSNVLNELVMDNIIEKKSIMSEGRGAPQIACRLKETPLALIKVLIDFHNPDLDASDFFLKRLIISPYAQSIINIEFVKFIESNVRNLIIDKLKVTDFHFNSKEQELLLKILRTSPSALYYATVDYNVSIAKIIKSPQKQLTHADDSNKEELKNKIIGIIRQNFFLNLQLKLGEDLNKNLVKFNEPIEYKISFKFLDDMNIGQFWKLHCENNEIETIFLRNNY
ncbi:MAG: hypothetical protein CVV29_06560 [Methanobacteriales archaeon HGW-Methanobacteriales-2]|nr:MAG: hypothetical protein CVV29_06560 [Methanobacteriales archaeon HGW-Methanobacteriales-2]